MDYCDACGQQAVARCPVDGGFVCNSHKWSYPVAFHRFVEQLESGSVSRPDTGPITIERADGTTRQLSAAFDVCDSCEKSARKTLVQRCAAALNSRHNGSKEHAYVDIATRFLGPLPVLGHHDVDVVTASITAMGAPRPHWLKDDAIRSLAALLAHVHHRSGRRPPAIRHRDEYAPDPRWYDRKKQMVVGQVATAWGWLVTADYLSDGYKRTERALIRADGNVLGLDRLGGPALTSDEIAWTGGAEPPEDSRFVSAFGAAPLVKPLLELIAPVLATMPSSGSLDDYFVQALGHKVVRTLSPAMKDRILREAQLRTIVEDMYQRKQGALIDNDPKLEARFIGIFSRAQ